MKYKLKAEYGGGVASSGKVTRIRELSDAVVEVILDRFSFLNLDKGNLTPKFKKLKVGENITYTSVYPHSITEVRNNQSEVIHRNKYFYSLIGKPKK